MMRYIQASCHLRSSDKILTPDEDQRPRSLLRSLAGRCFTNVQKQQQNIQVWKSAVLIEKRLIGLVEILILWEHIPTRW